MIQRRLLAELLPHTVALDATYGLNELGFPLYTLLTIDEWLYSVPVAWIIVQSEATEALQDALTSVRDKVGLFLMSKH